MSGHDSRQRSASLAITLVLVGCSVPPAVSTPIPTVPQYSAETFFNTLSLTGGSVSADGDRLLISSNATGRFRIYALPVDGGRAEPLTPPGDDAQFALSWFWNDDRLLFRSDKGGNELDHLYLRFADGGIVDLTPADNCKANFVSWQDGGRAFHVATNERDPRYFDLYRYEVPRGFVAAAHSDNPLPRRMVYSNDDGLSLGPVSRDGRWLATVKTNDNRDSDVFLVDLADVGADPVLLTAHAGKAQFSPSAFSPDSDKLYLTTDEGSEFRYLICCDLASKERQRAEVRPWDIRGVSFTLDGRYRVMSVNVDARSELEVIEVQSGQAVALPRVPAGRTITGFETSRDGRRWIMRVAGDTSPGDFFVADAGGANLRALTNALPPEIEAADLVAGEVVRYPSFDGLQIPAILYRPEQARDGHRVPAVVLVHGGPGGQSRVAYSPNSQFLLNRGYAILAVNNRGSSGYGKTFFHADDKRHGDVDLKDCIAARSYLESLEWVDGRRVAIMGGSYGGYMVAAALAFAPDAFDAGIDIFGVTNWLRTLNSIPPWWEAGRQRLYAELGDPAVEAERLRAISPLFHAANIDKPLLVVQGANDPRVLQVESDELVAAVEANGVPVEYVLFADEGHGFVHRKNQIVAAKAYLRFLDRYLRDAPR